MRPLNSACAFLAVVAACVFASVSQATVHHSIGGLINYSSGPAGTDGFEGATFLLEMDFPDVAVPDSTGSFSSGGVAYNDATYSPLAAKLTITNTVGNVHNGVFNSSTSPTVSAPIVYLRKYTQNAGVFQDTLSYRADLLAAGVLNNSWNLNFAVNFGLGTFADTSLFPYTSANYTAVGGGLGIPATITTYSLTGGAAGAVVPEPAGLCAIFAVAAIGLMRRRV